MNPRTLIIFAVVLGALALGWAMRDRSPVVGSPDVTAREPAPAQRKAHDESAEVPRAQRPSSAPGAPAAQSTRALSESPVDVAARAKFNDNARLFFASASSLSEDERRREAGLISEEL